MNNIVLKMFFTIVLAIVLVIKSLILEDIAMAVLCSILCGSYFIFSAFQLRNKHKASHM